MSLLLRIHHIPLPLPWHIPIPMRPMMPPRGMILAPRPILLLLALMATTARPLPLPLPLAILAVVVSLDAVLPVLLPVFALFPVRLVIDLLGGLPLLLFVVLAATFCFGLSAFPRPRLCQDGRESGAKRRKKIGGHRDHVSGTKTHESMTMVRRDGTRWNRTKRTTRGGRRRHEKTQARARRVHGRLDRTERRHGRRTGRRSCKGGLKSKTNRKTTKKCATHLSTAPWPGRRPESPPCSRREAQPHGRRGSRSAPCR